MRVSKGKLEGGRIFMDSQEIVIGWPHANDHDLIDTLMHEFLESSMMQHNVRYGCQLEDVIFVFDHRTFKVLCSELAATVLKLMKANGYKGVKE